MLVALRAAPTEKREARLDVKEMFANKAPEEPKSKEQERRQNQNLVIRTQGEDKHGSKQRGKTSSEEAEEHQVRSAAGEYKMQADTGLLNLPGKPYPLHKQCRGRLVISLLSRNWISVSRVSEQITA